MTDSMSLITAQIHFLDTQLVLVHIPIEQYPIFLQPILRLVFGEDHDEDAEKIPWTNRHDFFNLSITPDECSIICSKQLAQKYIVPVQKLIHGLFKPRGANDGNATIYKEQYTVVQVDGQGLDAGQRVLELTGPLAMAGISIFFITTYFCDYILVPSKARRTVTLALEQRGFVFSKENDAFISQLSPSLHYGNARPDSSSSDEAHPTTKYNAFPCIPSTPPAKDINELQARTFNKLKRYNIKPWVDETLRLVSCAGDQEPDAKKDARLKNDLLQVLMSTPKGRRRSSETASNIYSNPKICDGLDLSPAFLSLTITASEPVSILLEERLLPRLGKSLYGAKSTDDILVPVMFDLSQLAFETTGIIGGVASRLSLGRGRRGSFVVDAELSPSTALVNEGLFMSEISFLSTTRAGSVILRATDLSRAMEALTFALEEPLD